MVCSAFAAVAVSYAGLLLFLYGFFLTRRELGRISQYNAPLLKEVVHDPSNGSLLKSFSGDSDANNGASDPIPVFLFIVDALRLDFMTLQDDKQESSPYNRFEFMHHLLQYNASQCGLFGFRADPPTVTSQRLKGLMTGTLPTFVDIGSNFNSSSISEDNVIDQLLKRKSTRKSRLVVLGDDTWKSVFPNQFDVVHVYDSFNTKDLHTVDNGILAHLNDSLHAEWDLFVAHFLGVDHIGHSYHAHHPLMGERLRLMDQLLSHVISQLPENGVLLLFGDHGMTDEGEHGGASQDETDSGVFVYSRKKMFDVIPHKASGEPAATAPDAIDAGALISSDHDRKLMWDADTRSFVSRTVRDLRTHPRVVSQIDLTPTLSQWLGLPIPYSSLGMIIPELFMLKDVQAGPSASLTDLLFVNAMQVWRYLLDYFGDDSKEHQDRLIRLERMLSSSQCSSNLEQGINGTSAFGCADTIRSNSPSPDGRLEPLWQLLLGAVEHHRKLLTEDGTDGERLTAEIISARYVDFLSAAQQFGRDQWTQFNLPCMLGGLLILLTVVAVQCAMLPLISVRDIIIPVLCNPDSLVMILLAVFHALSVFSNSFIIEEHWIHLYAMQSFALWLAFQGSTVHPTLTIDVSLLSGVTVLLSLSRLVWTTPVLDTLQSESTDEKMTSPSFDWITAELAGLLKKHHLLGRWVVSSLCLLAILFLLRTCESFVVPRVSGLLSKIQTCSDVVCVVILVVYWYLEVQNTHETIGAGVVNRMMLALPRVIFFLFAASVVTCVFAYRLRDKWKTTSVPEFCQSCLSGLFGVCRTWVWVLCLMLGKDQTAPVLVLLLHLMVSVRLVERHLVNSSALKNRRKSRRNYFVDGDLNLLSMKDVVQGCSDLIFSEVEDDNKALGSLSVVQVVSVALYFNMIGRFVFFVTGHGMSFAKLKLSSGFIGLESFDFILSGILLAVNTFGCDVLVLMALFITAARWRLREVTVHDRTITINRLMFRITLIYRLSLLLCSCGAAALHRRHLMVWAVFAPKVAFESAFWLVGGFLLVLLAALFHL